MSALTATVSGFASNGYHLASMKVGDVIILADNENILKQRFPIRPSPNRPFADWCFACISLYEIDDMDVHHNWKDCYEG